MAGGPQLELSLSDHRHEFSSQNSPNQTQRNPLPTQTKLNVLFHLPPFRSRKIRFSFSSGQRPELGSAMTL